MGLVGVGGAASRQEVETPLAAQFVSPVLNVFRNLTAEPVDLGCALPEEPLES